jgi:hypothetical protein
MINYLREIRRKLKHVYHGYPIYKVVDYLKEKNVLENTITLEAFANTGEHQAPAYYKYAKYFEAWEISPEYEKDLRMNLPNAVVKITNTFDEVKISEKRFNFIVMDAHMGVFGDKNQYCEHFEILPEIFRLCMDECTLLFNVMPYCEEKWKEKYSTVFRTDHLERRKKFYHCEDPNHVSYEEMRTFYTAMCRQNGFNVEWIFYHQRHLLHYCAIRMKKIKA